jgi:hypothetical protein
VEGRRVLTQVFDKIPSPCVVQFKTCNALGFERLADSSQLFIVPPESRHKALTQPLSERNFRPDAPVHFEWIGFL